MRSRLSAILMVAVLWGCQTQAPTTNTAGTRAPDAVPSNSLPAARSDGPSAQPAAQVEPADPVVASVRGENITLHQLEQPLIEAYGLNVLLEVVQVDLAGQEARQKNIVISEQDAEDETVRTLIAFRKATDQINAAATTEPSTQPSDESLSAADRDHLLTMLLSSQHLNRTDFDLAMRRNAILRKLVAPTALAQLTDDNLHERFNAIYGEKARVRFIRMGDMAAIAGVERDLSSGKTFADEVRLHAYDSVGRPSSGELAPFSRKDVNYPADFKMVTFGLKPGQVSDPVQIKDSIYLIQLLELTPPQHANFDTYKDSVRKELYEETVQEGITQYINELRVVARQTLEVKNPTLRSQWEVNLRNADELRDQLKTQAAATQPAAAGVQTPADAPAATTVPSMAN